MTTSSGPTCSPDPDPAWPWPCPGPWVSRDPVWQEERAPLLVAGQKPRWVVGPPKTASGQELHPPGSQGSECLHGEALAGPRAPPILTATSPFPAMALPGDPGPLSL